MPSSRRVEKTRREVAEGEALRKGGAPSLSPPLLSKANLENKNPNLLPANAFSSNEIRIMHFGPGAFFRGHQAWFYQRLLKDDPSWGISCVSLRSALLREYLAPQDGLYTLLILDSSYSFQVMGGIREMLVACEDREAVLARLADPVIQLVTATITEKGYCLTNAGDLDVSHPEIQQDLSQPRFPGTFIGFLVEGLRRRRAAGIAPPDVVSCDNLSNNGRRLRRAVVQFAAHLDPELADWIDCAVCFPNTMVDSITPAATSRTREDIERLTGFYDASPVCREPYIAWMIEDRLNSELADALKAAGVEIAANIEFFEKAKVRLLNGAHSALAYLSAQSKADTVAEAMELPGIAEFLSRMMEEEICPTLSPPDNFDLSAYCSTILDRFQNSYVAYKLTQVQSDGSQKIPHRILSPLIDNLDAGRRSDRLVAVVAAWIDYCLAAADGGDDLNDPAREAIFAAVGDGERNADDIINAFLRVPNIFPDRLKKDDAFQAVLKDSLQSRRCGQVLVKQNC